MPTTRSTSKKQTKLEDFTEEAKQSDQSSQVVKKQGKRPSVQKDGSESNPSAKRKAPPSTQDKETTKKPRASSSRKTNDPHKSSEASATQSKIVPSSASEGNLSTRIRINRSPILHLWSACVTSTMHPTLSWSTCLSCGSAIASLCAISKGRAIGKIDTQPKEESSKSAKQPSDAQSEIAVMGFPLRIKDGVVVVSGKSKTGDEQMLRRKFATDEEYEEVKKVMMRALEDGGGGGGGGRKKDDLEKEAFGMYETFRPEVPRGEKGWGRKGELDLEKVRNAIVS